MQAKHESGLVERIIAWLAAVLAPRPEPVAIRVRREPDPRGPRR